MTQLVVRPSLARFMEDVRLGTLDFTLTKPVDAQVLISVRQVEVWKLVDVVVGLVVLGGRDRSARRDRSVPPRRSRSWSRCWPE